MFSGTGDLRLWRFRDNDFCCCTGRWRTMTQTRSTQVDQFFIVSLGARLGSIGFLSWAGCDIVLCVAVVVVLLFVVCCWINLEASKLESLNSIHLTVVTSSITITNLLFPSRNLEGEITIWWLTSIEITFIVFLHWCLEIQARVSICKRGYYTVHSSICSRIL